MNTPPFKEPSIVLTKQQFHSMTRSYSRKINLSNHVPDRDYESIDLFSSHNEEIPLGTPQAEIDALSNKLFEMAKADVEIAATALINSMKRAAGITVEPVGEEYKQIADIIVMLESAVTTDDVKKAVDLIKEKKDTLNDGQLEYLRSISRKAEARTLK